MSKFRPGDPVEWVGGRTLPMAPKLGIVLEVVMDVGSFRYRRGSLYRIQWPDHITLEFDEKLKMNSNAFASIAE